MSGSPNLSQDAQASPSRRLAAIMFTDLVGYSALAHLDEALAIELLDLHRGWVREIVARHGGVEIETVGDAFLLEFPGALAAFQCAIEIQRRFADHNVTAPAERRMQLRVGIHLGDVEHRDGKVIGDGVNIASRIHGRAAPGGICMSAGVMQAIRNRTNLRFESLGHPELKNIATRLELFRVLPPGVGARMRLPFRHARLRQVTVLSGLALLAVLVVAAAMLWRSERGPQGNPSIAVLPFENLSAEPDSAHFTDGLHDSVIGHLARVPGVKVISRTSVMRYRDTSAGLRRIASELGVQHVLEGSVQRSGGRLRVVAQLIDAQTDAHVWSEEYDRELADIFAVQADIARQVATSVHIQLTPQTQERIARVPTQNETAYDLYLRALAVIRNFAGDEKALRNAEVWLTEAIALDSRFAHAYATRAQVHNNLHWIGFDPVPARRRAVAADLERALSIDPDLFEARVAKAQHLYHGLRDYDAAVRELETAAGLAPGNGEVSFWLGTIYRRQGRWADALGSFERATWLDPLNVTYLGNYAVTLSMLRRYADADRLGVRLEALAPDHLIVKLGRSSATFYRTGNLDSWDRALARIPRDLHSDCSVAQNRWDLRMLQRRFLEAADAVAACRDPYVASGGGEQIPVDFFLAMAYWAAGDSTRARAIAKHLREKMRQWLTEDPDRVQARLVLGFALVILGDNEAALREARTALSTMPVSRDALFGAEILSQSANLHALAGDHSGALDLLEKTLRLPAGLELERVRASFHWDALRSDARFQDVMLRASASKPR